jgi:transposase
MSFIRNIKRGDKVYRAEVESRRIDGKIVQRHIRYIGRSADEKKVLSTPLSDVSVEQVKLYGPLLVLDYFANVIGLREAIGPFAGEVLSLVYAHCVDYKSINKMERWFERTDLNMLLGIDGLTEARLLGALDALEKLDQTVVQRKIFRNVRDIYKLGNRGLIYDVTNTYFYGKSCPLGKYGKDKDGVKGRPLIQIGLGVTRKDGIPVFHHVLDGNIHDSRIFQDAITAFRQYGIEDVLVVFDRGISSKKNQLDLKNLNLKVLCGLPLNDELKKIIRVIRKAEDIVSFRNRVELNDSVFYVHIVSHSIGGVNGRLAICLNERRRFEAKESRFRKIAEAQRNWKKTNDVSDGVKRFLGSDGRVLMHRVIEAEEFDGCSCIFTTATRMSKTEMVHQYFDKDLVEKAFHDFKNVIKVRPIRHWLEKRVRAHIFICYLSYLLLSLLNMHMKSIEMTAVQALEELESLYKVYLKDCRRGFREHRIVALTKKQESIMRAIDKRLLRINKKT